MRRCRLRFFCSSNAKTRSVDSGECLSLKSDRFLATLSRIRHAVTSNYIPPANGGSDSLHQLLFQSRRWVGAQQAGQRTATFARRDRSHPARLPPSPPPVAAPGQRSSGAWGRPVPLQSVTIHST
jgi:hypothetical protein